MKIFIIPLLWAWLRWVNICYILLQDMNIFPPFFLPFLIPRNNNMISLPWWPFFVCLLVCWSGCTCQSEWAAKNRVTGGIYVVCESSKSGSWWPRLFEYWRGKKMYSYVWVVYIESKELRLYIVPVVKKRRSCI